MLGTRYRIGRFASIGRGSVRMLRHFPACSAVPPHPRRAGTGGVGPDEIGLLAPARADPVSGYRSYAPEQLADLAGIMRVGGLGLGFVDIAGVVRTDEGDPAVRELLRSAREALRRSTAADADRLARFDAYLR